jgi:hypothetical protein
MLVGVMQASGATGGMPVRRGFAGAMPKFSLTASVLHAKGVPQPSNGDDHRVTPKRN